MQHRSEAIDFGQSLCVRRALTRQAKYAMILALSLLCGLAWPASAATITVACGAVGVEFDLCRQGAEMWAARTRHTIRMISTPNDANERLALFQQLLAARSPDIDVFQIDVVWPGILAPYLADLEPQLAREEIADHLPGLSAHHFA